MARWEPDAPGRLAQAALDLFTERGYENTTVIDIARRAKLGKSSFFRHFADKREVLFGGDAIDDLLVEAILAAPSSATPLEAIAHAFDVAGRQAFTPDRREAVARRRAVIAANPELQEREALKNLGIAASMASALERRGVAHLTARVVAQVAGLAGQVAFERWSQDTTGSDFADLARQSLADVSAAAATSCNA